MKKFLCFILCFALIMSFAACGDNETDDQSVDNISGQKPKDEASKDEPGITSSKSLMTGVVAQAVQADSNLEDDGAKIAGFGAELFKNCLKGGKNMLVSPLSALYALTMTANGADGNTKAEMETVLGMPIEELNTYLYSYGLTTGDSEKGKLDIANAIWYRNGFTAYDNFLQTNADYYGADIYKAPFDMETVKDVNNWVNKKTDGMIPQMVEEFDDSAVVYLLNAICFDAKWQELYTEDDIRSGTFTTEDGKKQQIELMSSSEELTISTDLARGFIKPYKGGKYGFAALLPNEGVSVYELALSLDGEKINDLIANPKYFGADVSMPKFELECEIPMAEVLKKMGIKDAFDGTAADFTKIGKGNGNVYISDVLQKTFISVDENGTKAAASTSVTVDSLGATPAIVLNRPFIYMIVDLEANTPIFIGAFMDAE